MALYTGKHGIETKYEGSISYARVQHVKICRCVHSEKGCNPVHTSWKIRVNILIIIINQ